MWVHYFVKYEGQPDTEIHVVFRISAHIGPRDQAVMSSRDSTSSRYAHSGGKKCAAQGYKSTNSTSQVHVKVMGGSGTGRT